MLPFEREARSACNCTCVCTGYIPRAIPTRTRHVGALCRDGRRHDRRQRGRSSGLLNRGKRVGDLALPHAARGAARGAAVDAGCDGAGADLGVPCPPLLRVACQSVSSENQVWRVICCRRQRPLCGGCLEAKHGVSGFYQDKIFNGSVSCCCQWVPVAAISARALKAPEGSCVCARRISCSAAVCVCLCVYLVFAADSTSVYLVHYSVHHVRGQLQF